MTPRRCPPPSPDVGVRALTAVAAASLLTVVLLLAGCASSGPEPQDKSGPDQPTAEVEPAPAAVKKRPYDGPITHLGRTVLGRCQLIARVKAVSNSPPLHGTEIGRMEIEEVMWGHTSWVGDTMTVLCAEPGVLPRRGRGAVLLLELKPGSRNAAVVQVIPLDDADSPERLVALREYLLFEQLPVPQDRAEQLLDHLRRAALSRREWTRWNAVEEYASLSRVAPELLRPMDERVLTTVRGQTEDPALTELIDEALKAIDPQAAAAVAAAAPARPTGPSATPRAQDVDTLLREFRDKATTAQARTQLVIDGARRFRAASGPLLRAAMQDPDPAVREVGAAAAGAAGASAVGPSLLAMLGTEQVPEVRRAIVVSLGHLREASAIPALATLAADNAPLGREAAFALARIRNEAAVSALREIARTTPDATHTRLVEFLLSDHFLEQERALGPR